MTAKSETPTQKRELTIVRTFDAPRELVFDAWTKPEHTVKWMGPRDYPACSVKQDLRPGGEWRICLRSPTGEPDLWQGGIYKEIDRPARLVLTFGWDKPNDEHGAETLVTLTFEELDGKTRMTFHQAVFENEQQMVGHNYGWNSTFDRLEDLINASQI